jgi:hypothetical protein
MFVPGGPERHPIEGEDALRNFLLTDLELPPGVTETATTELDKSGRCTIENIVVTDKINVPRIELDVPRTTEASPTKAAPRSITTETRQTQTNEEGEAEGPVRPLRGTREPNVTPRAARQLE